MLQKVKQNNVTKLFNLLQRQLECGSIWQCFGQTKAKVSAAMFGFFFASSRQNSVSLVTELSVCALLPLKEPQICECSHLFVEGECEIVGSAGVHFHCIAANTLNNPKKCHIL